MESCDFISNHREKDSSSKRSIVIASTSSTTECENKSTISAIVALHQTQSNFISSKARRINRQAPRNQLIGILTENNGNRKSESATRKRAICVEPRTLPQAGLAGNTLQIHRDITLPTIVPKSSIAGGNNPPLGKQKIPRPANAFMLFANEWRKKLAIENPRESNKDISVRLGVLWKNMDKDIKEKYFTLAREVDAEHKRKYPDYVYNPKEARLRKAMREQSRELSRQTILQTAIASATGSANVSSPNCGGNNVTGNISPSAGTTNFLHRPLICPPSIVAGASIAAATVSSLPSSPSFNSGNRTINPWFPAAHGPPANHLKPILSPRVMTVAQHQQQQQHRTFDKTKEVLRKQAECAVGGAFSAASNAAYPSNFPAHSNPENISAPQSSTHEDNEYCVIADFSDSQKWHSYQNGPSPYHSRASGPLMKMEALHPSMQSNNPHGHSGWNQFCSMPLSTVNRTPRHLVFLQEQQQNQNCGFSDGMQIPYMQNKHIDNSHRMHPGYMQQSHQSKLQSNAMSPLNMSQLRESEKTMEDGPRWESNASMDGSSGEGSIDPTVLQARREIELEKLHQEVNKEKSRSAQQPQNRDREQSRYNENSSPIMAKQKKGCYSKQPLPGFHQAFGSTEIGRFSRSEFFANMVAGDNTNNVSNNSQNSCNSSNNGMIHMIDTCASDDLGDTATSSNNIDNCSIRRMNSPALRNRHNEIRENLDDCNSQGNVGNDNTTFSVGGQNDRTSFNDSIGPMGNYYNDVIRSPGPSGGSAIVGASTIPRWHSPYVSAIGSEI